MTPFPVGKFGLIYADPAWRFSTRSDKGRGRCPDAPVSRAEQRRNTPDRHYETMTLDAIKALPVADLAADDCVLVLWAVDPLLPEAIEVGRAWGFTYKTVAFYWAKMRREGSTRHLLHERPDHKMFPMGTGYWTRSNPEQALLFTRGRPKRLSAAVRKLVVAPRREHSRKPDEVHEYLEALTAGPYVELFGRAPVPGWTVWGNQTEAMSNDSPISRAVRRGRTRSASDMPLFPL